MFDPKLNNEISKCENITINQNFYCTENKKEHSKCSKNIGSIFKKLVLFLFKKL